MFALLFPGQGAQRAGMLDALTAIPGAAALLARASDVLGRDVLAADDARAYRSTRIAQCALVIAGVACAQALVALAGPAAAVAGHSAGAYAAAVAASALDFETALAAIDARGRTMEAAFAHGYGMGTVSGLDERSVAALAASVSQPHLPVYAANVNAPDQIAVAGALAGVDALLAAATAAGARAVRRLDVNIPSHCPLMDGVVAMLEPALPPDAVRRARIPVALNADGRLTRDAVRIRRDLIGNAAVAVRWADAQRALYESGVRTFLEMPPGSVLSDLAAAAFPDARAMAVDVAGLASACEAARRSAG